MEFNEVSLQDLSSIKHKVLLAQSTLFANHDFKVISYKGIYGVGSAGKHDARYIIATAKAAHEAWYTSAIVLDFAELEYEWGDEMEWVLDIGHQPITNCAYPLAIVVGSKCDYALQSLFGEAYDQLCYNSFEKAVESLKDKVANYQTCLQEWRKSKRRLT